MQTMSLVERLESVGKSDIDTPALLIDLDAMERNIAKMAKYFRGVKAKLRPHAKTHKTPIIAHKQIQAGARGITCAKLGEAEVMVAAGIRDILIANQVVGRQKIERLMRLAKHSDVVVAVDDPRNARDLSEAALRVGTKLNILIEVNVGMDRCGVEPGKPTLVLARNVLKLPGLRFRGVMGYEGHTVFMEPFEKRREECTKAMKLLIGTRDTLEDAGIGVEIVSAGGTGTYNISGEYPGVTEIQAGSYVLLDSKYKTIVPEFECALTVLTTVISKPTSDRAIVDMGMKAVTSEFGVPQPKGVKGVELIRLSEEHGKLQLKNPSTSINVCDKLEFVPTHCCTTINLHDRFYGVRGDRLEAIWGISGRGKFQ